MSGPGGAIDQVCVAVLEDHEMVATALEAALGRDPRLHVVGTASGLDEAFELVGIRRPDVLVTDLRLDGVEIADQLPRFHRAVPDLRILVVTGWATERTEAGVGGYRTRRLVGRRGRRRFASPGA